MFKLTPRFLITLATFVLGVGVTAAWFVNRAPKPHIVSAGEWEPLFFRAINARTGAANMPRLRDVYVPGEDIEVRFWIGFGTNGEDGFILRRNDQQWSGVFIQGAFDRYPPEKYQEVIPLAAPRSGWEGTWRRLVDAGILTLPDAHAIGCERLMLDGVGYIVEINMEGVYRTYKYGNPQFAQCAEAKRIIKMNEMLYEEFGVRQEL